MNQQTYAAKCGEPETNWLEVLKPGLSHVEVKRLYLLSTKWPTCACGNMCAYLPRTEGVPDDRILFDLGVDFSEALKDAYLAPLGPDSYVARARDIFPQIEARVDEILKGQS